MTAILARAIQQGQWVVVTAWQPHWIFARYQLRFLNDPKGIFGGVQGIHAVVGKGFQSTFPTAVTAFFSRFYIPDDELAAVLLDTQQMPVDVAVERYIRTHPQKIHYWLTGKIRE